MPTEAVRRPARALPAWTAVGEAQWLPGALLLAVAACVVAALSYHFLEKPILAYKDRLARS